MDEETSDFDDILQPDILTSPYNQSHNATPQSIFKNCAIRQLNEGKL